MLSKKHIDPWSCPLTVDVTIKFTKGYYSEAPKRTLPFFLPEGQNNGSESAGPLNS